MEALGDAALLSIWERGRGLDRVGRALVLAAAAIGDRYPAADLPIGARDSAIAGLRAATIGPRLHGGAQCCACGERLEFEFDCADVMAGLAPPTATEFEIAGLHFRLPNSRDLLAAAGALDADEAGRRVLASCCLDAPASPDWPDEVVRQAEARIASLDQAADICLDFACAACDATWTERLDIAAFFWDEIDQRAQALLDDVHCLARAYGWSEASILAMAPQRRRAYLQRCDA